MGVWRGLEPLNTGSRESAYRFEGYELDLGRRELRRNGATLTIQPKVLDLIAYLVEHRDRAVGKAELQDAIWPGVVVTETSLTQAIRKARLALGDDANRPSLIRTVHGHGYRFVAPLDDGPRTVSDVVGTVANDDSADVSVSGDLARLGETSAAHAAADRGSASVRSDAPTPEASPGDAQPTRGADLRPTVAVLPFVNLSGGSTCWRETRLSATGTGRRMPGRWRGSSGRVTSSPAACVAPAGGSA
jgi:DNA-binding winged helix-turn-helix (wHTH) protein